MKTTRFGLVVLLAMGISTVVVAGFGGPACAGGDAVKVKCPDDDITIVPTNTTDRKVFVHVQVSDDCPGDGPEGRLSFVGIEDERVTGFFQSVTIPDKGSVAPVYVLKPGQKLSMGCRGHGGHCTWQILSSQVVD
jgi:hypothetical protein